MIRCERYQHACASQRARRLKIGLFHLYLAYRGKRRPHNGRKTAVSDLLCDQMAFCAVIQREIQVKFLSDTDSSENIVCPVYMCLEWNLAFK